MVEFLYIKAFLEKVTGTPKSDRGHPTDEKLGANWQSRLDYRVHQPVDQIELEGIVRGFALKLAKVDAFNEGRNVY